MQSHLSKGVSAPSTPTDQETLPRLWYDYEVQAWVKHGVYTQCGHPASMRPGCCYAGSHAGEAADPSHCLDEVTPSAG